MRQTSTVEAPWLIVEGEDEAYRSITVASAIQGAIGRALDENRGVRIAAKPATPAAAARRGKAPAESRVITPAGKHGSSASATILSQLDMTQTVSKKVFATELEKQQGRINQLQRRAREKGVSTLLVFEGWDAAGKGGAIRRVTAALDAQDYQVIPIAAPTDEERAQHYLWRFWRHLSRAGRLTIFDRSWYGRVLVERVEGFATAAEWMRSYTEINEFEDQLVERGNILLKFWVHVTFEEQLRRFKEREKIAHKKWKLTDEDWRNRSRWADYEHAVNDMVERTSTRLAPWTIVEGNDKNFARLKVLRTIGDRMKAGLR
jgi:polyphosphate kinase 2 (PPK2 family)